MKTETTNTVRIEIELLKDLLELYHCADSFTMSYDRRNVMNRSEQIIKETETLLEKGGK